MLAKVYSAVLSESEATLVQVEVEVRKGPRRFVIIGMGDSAVQESRDRVVASLRTLGIRVPEQIVVNLAPASVRKIGTGLELGIAVGVLVAMGDVSSDAVANCCLVGELSLDGCLKPTPQHLALLLSILQGDISHILTPPLALPELLLDGNVRIDGVVDLGHARAVLKGEDAPSRGALPPIESTDLVDDTFLDEVHGLHLAKRALELALAGGHNLLLSGPPGCGKSMLLRRARSLLPSLTRAEVLEVARVYSLVGAPLAGVLRGIAPFRAPHHSVSMEALAGSSSRGIPRPGEFCLAHRGILFLDEMPEFHRRALEALRAPLEDGVVSIARSAGSTTFPAQFQLFAAMNPCPCGAGSQQGLPASLSACRCSAAAILRYRDRISQPLRERFDLKCSLKGSVEDEKGFASFGQLGSLRIHHDLVKERIKQARTRMLDRQQKVNRWLSTLELTKYAPLEAADRAFLLDAAQRQRLSQRGLAKVLRVARTIADLEGEESVCRQSLSEALILQLGQPG